MEQREKTRLSNESFINICMLLVLIAFFSIASVAVPRFFDINNIANVISQQANVIIIGIGVTFLLITGHFDLSVSGIIAFAGVLIAWLSQANTGSESPLANGLGLGYGTAIALTLAACILFGFLNAFFILKMHVASVIVTLGTMTISRGIALVLARGAQRNVGLPMEFKAMGKFTVIGAINLPVIIMIVLVLAALFIEKKTVFGRKMYYIGANISTARLSGIQVNKQVTALYLASAFLSGVTGILMASKFNAGLSSIAQGYEFDALVYTVLGGTSIAGGFGSVISLVIGAYIVGILQNSLNLLGLPPDIQTVMKGVVIILAILAQRLALNKRKV